MKKVLKYIGLFLLLVLIGGFITVKVLSEDLPQGITGPAAEQVAEDVLKAINNEALDTTVWLTWDFMMGHNFIWNQSNNTAKISWGDNEVVMQLDNQEGVAKVKGQEVQGEEKDKLIQTAWAHWCNDSFWLMAPNKIKDPGTQRSLVDVSAEFPNQKGLLVQYQSGGVTPGDAYLWIIGEDNIPTAYKMWTSIIPVKGVYASWEEWITISTGAKLATTHDANVAAFALSNIKGGQTWQELGLTEKPF